MRKYIKDNILKTSKTIYEAHCYIRECIDQANFDSAKSTLGDCQDAAIKIENTIKKFEGENTVTVSYLEEYCEMLYQVTIGSCVEMSAEQVQQLLDQRLVRIENSINNDIKIKYEIVFMPYKASMWDSLESVWKAADQDPDCDVYVVPIPYYDRKQDQSFGKFHYEGDEFPDYVPIIKYDAYDLEERHPDVIYIHNPYDQYNKVTSVDPHFYSYELKKHTDCLVYIPYFIVAGGKVNKYIITTSAGRYADRVILQSKGVRDVYSRVFNKSNHDNEHKFIALGSPKLDRIVNAKMSDFLIPSKWEQMIDNKKVVLYNTSINMTLSYTKELLLKLKTNFELFSNHKEYLLWWRPHPLLRATFESMRPEYLSVYDKLVSGYQEENIGIYDDTSQLTRAIVYSSIYYGESKSSIFPLFCATGKPAVIAHIDAKGEISSFNEDYIKYYRDNSNLEVLRRNENPDGTAGINIHKYIKGELAK